MSIKRACAGAPVEAFRQSVNERLPERHLRKSAVFRDILRLFVKNQPLLGISKPVVTLDEFDQLRAVVRNEIASPCC